MVHFFIISDRKKCFQQKLNQQIFNAIIGLIIYQVLIVQPKINDILKRSHWNLAYTVGHAWFEYSFKHIPYFEIR